MTKPILQRGAAETLDHLVHYLDEAARHLDEAARNIRRNPGICEDAIRDAGRDLTRIRNQLDDIAAMLERRALRDDLVAATQAMRELIARLEPSDDTSSVLPFPRREA